MLGFPTTKGPPQGGMPASRDFLNISSRVPSDEAPLQAPDGASSERERETLHPPSPLHPHLKVPGR
jgi:hypothetical protein